MAVIVTACGDDDSTVPIETPVVPTTQNGGGGDGGSGGGEGGGTSGGAGTATVTVSAGTFELQVEEDSCIISDVGIGAIASSDEASLFIAGPQELAVVTVELSSGDLWSAAAAAVVIDGTTMSYSGPAMGPGADSTISVEVFCNEVVTGPGG
jgi:hypothetical protein